MVFACGGEIDDAATRAGAGMGGAAGSGGSAGVGGGPAGAVGQAPLACPPPEPQKHRPAAATCAPSTPATPCMVDTDCPIYGSASGAENGKCVTTATGGVCDLNQCVHDADCPGPGDVCSCQGDTKGFGGSSVRSVCIAAGCRTDADCGDGGFCSPTVSASCGSFYGIQGYYCHSCKDTCIEDGDCGAGYCAFDPEVGHWACGTRYCAGLASRGRVSPEHDPSARRDEGPHRRAVALRERRPSSRCCR